VVYHYGIIQEEMWWKE